MTVFDAVRPIGACEAAQRAGLPLIRRGSRWWTRCPLHGEDTASLCLYDGDRGWYCYGCNQGGDAVRLYQLLYQLPPLEAAQRLATDFGLPISDFGRYDAPRAVKGTAYDLERVVRRWFHARWVALCDARHAADKDLRALAQRLGPQACWDDARFVRALRARAAADTQLDRMEDAARRGAPGMAEMYVFALPGDGEGKGG